MTFQRYRVPFLLFLYDAFIFAIAPFVGLFIRFEGEVDPNYFELLIPYMFMIVCVRLLTFYLFRLYHRMWRYASIHEMMAVLGAVTVSSAIITTYMIFANSGIPRSIHLLSWAFIIAFVGFSRLGLRVYYYFRVRLLTPATKVLIVGAGDAGAMLAKEIGNHWAATRKVVGFVDDDSGKSGQSLFGITVIGSRVELPNLVQKHKVSEIMIAMPSAPGTIIKETINLCRQTTASIKILPGLSDIIDGRVSLQQLRNIELEDLLRRDPVQLDTESIAAYLQDKCVLVTGAGGSIGSEICRQVAKFQPACLVLLGKGENSIYDIDQEMRERNPALTLYPVIADVRDEERMTEIFQEYTPAVVFHAAAHKHLPLMELQPREAVRNNVFGTKVVAEVAERFGAERFILISTDKAVNPSSVMGATKRIAEMLMQTMSQTCRTHFSAVRFGNVLGSRGSVVPLFRKQIAAGGPVTVTNPEMKRYFMTIPEAAQLVLQAGAISNGGEVLVLDMGDPIRIVDMAEDLIRLSGYEPYQDIEIVFTQSRPGEKLFEELLTSEEGGQRTLHAKIFRTNLRQVDKMLFAKKITQLRSAQSGFEVVTVIEEIVRGEL